MAHLIFHKPNPLNLAYFPLLLFFLFLSSLAAEHISLFSQQILDNVRENHGTETWERFNAWQRIVDENMNKSEKEKVKLVNDFFNQHIEWVEDIELWSKKDYWATPVETLIKKAGDCEDFSIAKYFTLLALNVPRERLKISYVTAIEYNQAHMVLTYYETEKSVPLVLDNINQELMKADARKDLKPIYSFDGESLWLSSEEKLGERVGSSSGIRLWSELRELMSREQ